MPQDPGEQDIWVWWKAKKWVLHLTVRFFRYHSRQNLSKEENVHFTEMYIVSTPMAIRHGNLVF